ncbi:HAMP domain-containing sensor histidine kinase [Paenisporosarcina sp. TG-14]|uniref:HAMP domain-containing sensor histidine kinase n=1 Tax=Paenisporosarcina sp. TG-14 TaxID=1231057 RepID=UPI00031FF87D|nr:sensor histidine kinase [Paenisporosarcina sp. TG-14]
MNRISMKLAAYFLLAVLILEGLMMIYLHRTIVHAQEDAQFSQLLERGANHRDVLQDSYSQETLMHIELMESSPERQVAILDLDRQWTAGSDSSKALVDNFQQNLTVAPARDSVIINDWQQYNYIVTLHPFEAENGQRGSVVMFESSESLHSLMERLNIHFRIAGLASLLILFVVYVGLSRIITRPLIRMKEATERLSTGDFRVKLTHQSRDELGELSKSIQKLADDLEHTKKERMEFLAAISHELRTPLTYLSGYSSVLKRDDLSAQDRQRYVSILEEESTRLTELVKNLFDLAQMGETTFTISKESVQSSPFFSNVLQRVEPSFQLEEKYLQLSIREEFEMFVDPVRVEQIVINLLDNARKYSPIGSTTRMDVFLQDGQTVIRIEDEGIGIHPHNFELIFEKLVRVEKSRSREYGGAGLGLAIVKELVDAHGGRIEVISDVGKGSVFTVIL